MIRVTQVRLLDRMFLLGPPGIGKTEIIKQLARREADEVGRTFVDLRQADEGLVGDIMANPRNYYVFLRIVAPHIFPEDLSYPRRVEQGVEHVKFIAPRELTIFSLEGVAGVLFIDEITNVQRRDQLSMYFSIIQEKEVAWNLRLSSEVKVVLAGNPPEHSSVANLLPAPLVNKMTVVEVSPPTVEEWAEYMQRRRPECWWVASKAAGYLKYYQGDFIRPPSSTECLENYPTPRSWTELCEALTELGYEEVPLDDFAREVIVGKLGKEVGARFYGFLRKRPPTLDELLRRPEVLRGLDVEAKILALNQAAQNPGRLTREGGRLVRELAEGDRDLLVLLIMMMRREDRAGFIMAYERYVRQVVDAMVRYSY